MLISHFRHYIFVENSDISSQYHEVFLWISIVLMISSFCHFILFNLYLSKKAEENYINFVKSQEEKTFYYYQQKQKDIEDLNIIRHDLKKSAFSLKIHSQQRAINTHNILIPY